MHWFHKHPVDSIVETDRTADGVAVRHHYTYASPGWAYEDDEFIKAEHRTWSQWRGYSRVTTVVGHPDTNQLKTERLYFRGLHGDRAAPSGGTKSVSVTDSWGDVVTDHRDYQGMLREEIVYDGSAKLTSTVHDPWRSSVTADDGKRQTRMVDVAATREHTRLASGWRTAGAQYTYDSHGLLIETNDRGDIATTGDDLCTRIEYTKNTSAWILETVKRSETVSVRCSVSPSRPADVVSDQRFSYDGAAYGAAPTRGNVTRWIRAMSTTCGSRHAQATMRRCEYRLSGFWSSVTARSSQSSPLSRRQSRLATTKSVQVSRANNREPSDGGGLMADQSEHSRPTTAALP